MKTKFPSAISLTQQQINWMRQQPNASELIGHLIDALMSVDNLTLENFHAVQLKTTLENLQNKRSFAEEKRRELLRVNEYHFKRIQITEGLYTNWHVVNPLEPIDDDGKIALVALAAFDESIKQLETEIAKVKTELLQPLLDQHA
jgi:hypothetical protein